MKNDWRSFFGEADLAVTAVEAAAFAPVLVGGAVCAVLMAHGRPLDVAVLAGGAFACGGLALYVLMLRWMVRGL